MNYANLIEDAKLKKTFILATLVTTVIGTLQAATTLHDKIEEKRERRAKQSELDTKQNKALKELQEKLKQLQAVDNTNNNNDGEGNEGAKEGEKNGKDNNNEKKDDRSRPRSRSSSSRSRSRSRRRRRSREEWEDNMYFAEATRRSQAMIERTYNDHLQRLGPIYAQGDLITENALQAQTIRLQQTVIGILQEALNTGRGLSRDDLDTLIAAQNSARDGSINALNGQYNRIAYRRPPQGFIRDGSPIEVATYEHEPARLRIEPAKPANNPPWRSSPTAVRETAMVGRESIDEGFRRSSTVPPPPPPGVQRDMARMALGSPPTTTGSRRASRKSSPSRAATAVATIDAKVTPKDLDRGRDNQRQKSRAGSPPPRRKSTSPVSRKSKSKANAPERDMASLVNSAPSLMDKGTASTTVAKTNVTQIDGKTAAAASPAAKPRRDSGMPIPTTSNNDTSMKRSQSMISRAPRNSSSSSPLKQKQDFHSKAQKTLPEAPYELFCKYSVDLQTSKKPLSTSFRPAGDHRCPACDISIPVDTRDVWVLSTHFPGRHGVREYRMDSRFVVKCHRPEGGFACVLCDRFRDMDCLCKSVDALVKHLGTAHTPDEFERDPDLVRMKDGEGFGVKSREMVYV
ncbi:uncharacterized protein RCC_04996 [Ramularia collo-cygni]|uniref:C2H2-type domain-containing protein n=1 Tax=Ramularia collo-cygni TaxID=112498 RepID=A0A2D3V0Z3_9PEZI|nr:uncharacterized protein RCC_04996 [Ramularia collo-cygni]CZT19150.1 uncharacterized protein RCC_04996 [Ramularia collo-cygni]